MLLNYLVPFDQKVLSMEDNIVCSLLVLLHLQMIKQKVYLLLENLDQLNNLNIGFIFMLIFLIDFIPVNFSFKTRF